MGTGGRRLEHDYATRRNRHRGAGPRVTADTRPFLRFLVMALFPCRFRIPITGRCASRHRNASLVYASVYKRDIGIEPHVCGGELGLIGRPSVRQLRRPIMRNLITTIALLALVDSSVAIAQTAGSRNPAAPQPTTSGQQLLPDPAPVGHR